MRPVICKCPNHNGCLLGYHGDDIPIEYGSPMVCPECDADLRPLPKPHSDALYNVANMIGVVAAAAALWFAWPSIVKLWHKATTPPPRSAPAKAS